MIKLNSAYNRDNFLQFLEEYFLTDFMKDIRPTSTQGLSSIQKAYSLGRSEHLDLQVFEFSLEGSSNKRVTLTKDAFQVMRSHTIFQALAIFHSPSSDDWRLSLMTATPERTEKGKVALLYSSPKRLSFFLGPNAKTKTPIQLLIKKGQVKSWEDLATRFSVEVVNKEFYAAISEAYLKLIGKNSDDAQMKLPNFTQHGKAGREFAVRLIGRVIFCWFLKLKASQKGSLIPDELLTSKSVNNYEDYYHEVLEPLFFEVLNTETEARQAMYKSQPWQQVPYLNGGLFSPDKDNDFYDTDYLTGKSVHTNTLKIPNDWFYDLYTTLETYNFTIDENTLIDQELSIDPEMLGRIFENLLAEEINEETKESARKSTGSFYTPRQIVEYMVNESLVSYLKNYTNVDLNKLEALVGYGELNDFENLLDDREKDRIIAALSAIKVLDPACGSGAFPIGMLQKIVHVLQKLDPGAQKWLDSKVENIPDESFKQKLRQDYQAKSLDYVRKSFVIRDSIFGIDMQPIAVEVAKLRCFLTLIIDEDINDSEANRGIDTLPNLDFKFVAANTLIKPPTMSQGLNLDQDFDRRLERAIEKYFQPRTPQQKHDALVELSTLISEKERTETRTALSYKASYY